MTQKVSKKDQNKLSKKELRKNIEIKLESALSELKSDVDQKKFKHLIKKAGKLFSTVASRTIKPEVTKQQEVTIEMPAKNKSKVKEPKRSVEKV